MERGKGKIRQEGYEGAILIKGRHNLSLGKEAENEDVPRPYGYINHARVVRAAHGCGIRTAPVAFLRYTTGGCRGYKKGREAG